MSNILEKIMKMIKKRSLITCAFIQKIIKSDNIENSHEEITNVSFVFCAPNEIHFFYFRFMSQLVDMQK